MKRFEFRLAEIGIVGGVCSIAWWWDFYTKVQQVVGGKGALPIQCLYDGTGPCALIANVASFAGMTPYKPLAFVASAIVTFVGMATYLAAFSMVPSDPARNL